MAKGILIAAMNIAQRGRGRVSRLVRHRAPARAAACARVSRVPALDRRRGPEISVATYDLDTVGVLQSPGYQAIGGANLSPWSKRVTSRVERLMRFEGDQILPGDQLPPDNAGGLLLNAMNVEPAAEAEFNEWYDNEHIPALAAVPGVLCARRFRATSANRRYVALYHLVSPDVQATPAWKSAADSEWTRRMRPHFRDHLRLVCKKYVRGR